MILPATPDNIRKASEYLKSGELVAFPTETVYGLGANCFDRNAVKKIFAAKGRPASNPLIVHIADLNAVDTVASCDQIHRSPLEKLARSFWPGPLSVILPAHSDLAPEVTGGRTSVAIRIPDHPTALELIREARLPLAAPSANRSEYISPTRASHVLDCLGSAVKCILDGPRPNIGIESTVLSLLNPSEPVIFRPGAISPAQLEEVLGRNVRLHGAVEQAQPGKGPASPGMLSRHYSPDTPVALYGTVSAADYPDKVSFISLGPLPDDFPSEQFYSFQSLSSENNLEVAASRLYQALREEDARGAELILVSSCPNSGIGRAIMDRLERACHNRASSRQISSGA